MTRLPELPYASQRFLWLTKIKGDPPSRDNPPFRAFFFSILLESFRFEDKDDCPYEIFSVLSSARACASVKSFIILLSAEGLISFSVNNCTNFFGEKT